MKRYFLFFIFLSFLHILKAQEILRAEFAKSPLVIDGNMQDWSEPFHFFDKSSGFFYAVCNDSNNLYLAFRTAEPSTQMRFVELGMLLQIDIKAKKTHRLYLEFPFGMKDKKNVFSSNTDNEIMPQFFNFNEQERQYAFYYEKKEKQIFKMDSGIIPIKVFWDNKKMMTIEMAIPFKTVFQSSQFHLSDVKSSAINMILNAFDRSTQKVSGTEGSPSDYGDIDNIARSGNGKSFGNDRKKFRQQYEKFAQQEITNNRRMYNSAQFSQAIQLATSSSE